MSELLGPISIAEAFVFDSEEKEGKVFAEWIELSNYIADNLKTSDGQNYLSSMIGADIVEEDRLHLVPGINIEREKEILRTWKDSQWNGVETPWFGELKKQVNDKDYPFFIKFKVTPCMLEEESPLHSKIYIFYRFSNSLLLPIEEIRKLNDEIKNLSLEYRDIFYTPYLHFFKNFWNLNNKNIQNSDILYQIFSFNLLFIGSSIDISEPNKEDGIMVNNDELNSIINKFILTGEKNPQKLFYRFIKGEGDFRCIYCRRVEEENHLFAGLVNSQDMGKIINASKAVALSFINPL